MVFLPLKYFYNIIDPLSTHIFFCKKNPYPPPLDFQPELIYIQEQNIDSKAYFYVFQFNIHIILL